MTCFQPTPPMRWFHCNRFRFHLMITPNMVGGGCNGDTLCQGVKPCILLGVLSTFETTFFEQFDITLTITEQLLLKVSNLSFRYLLCMPIFTSFFLLLIHMLGFIVMKVWNLTFVLLNFLENLCGNQPFFNSVSPNVLVKFVSGIFRKDSGSLKMRFLCLK